jgi:hypothetical protein
MKEVNMPEFNTQEDAIAWFETQKYAKMRNLYFVFESEAENDEKYNELRFDGFKCSHNRKYHGVTEQYVKVAGKTAIILCEWG